jgi:hypothetical protein
LYGFAKQLVHIAFPVTDRYDFLPVWQRIRLRSSVKTGKIRKHLGGGMRKWHWVLVALCAMIAGVRDD